jgi:hypothetical protein
MRPLAIICLGAALAAGSTLNPAAAADALVLAGAEGARNAGYAYLGYLAPLPGSALGKGWVHREWLDALQYSYDASEQITARSPGFSGAIGYQGGDASAAWAGYLGLRFANTRLSPDDPGNVNRGFLTRAQAQFEYRVPRAAAGAEFDGLAQWEFGSRSWFARMRLNGWKFGPELVLKGSPDYSAVQIGVTTRIYDNGAGDALTLKGGVTRQSGDSTGPYLGLEWVRGF